MEKGDIWRHIASGKMYEILGKSFNATTDSICVRYIPYGDKEHPSIVHLGSVECDEYTRNLVQFLDGRFELVKSGFTKLVTQVIVQ